jgi:hypothetical protein
MMRSFLLAAVLLQMLGCSTLDTHRKKSADSAEVDPHSACRQHCLLNFNACMRTANSQDARNECIETYNWCTSTC